LCGRSTAGPKGPARIGHFDEGAVDLTIQNILKRTGLAILTILATSLLTFCLLRAMPGDIFYTMARDLSREQSIPLENAYVQVIQRYNYDPDEPLVNQLERYYGALLQGNLGTSMVFQSKTVNDIIAYALPWTLFITCLGLSITFVLGITLGSLMVWHRKGFLNAFLTTICTVTSAIPVFVWAFLLMVLFVFQLGWFPINGSYDIAYPPGFNLPFLSSVLYHAVLPVMTYVLTMMGMWALQMKSSGISVMGEDYITAAYARGLSSSVIRKRYMMRNAMLPVITMLAVTFAMMISTGSFVETTYTYPGMGRQLTTASGNRDYTVMQGLLLVMSMCTILANLITDFIYLKLDPRIKTGG
jgi:peptide/nickel transport system permease protein